MAPSGGRHSLGDYFALQRGTTYKSALLGLPGPILLGLATIQRNGGFRADSLRTYGGSARERLLVQPGDLYVSLKDVTQAADLLGAVARLPARYGAGRLTQDTVRLDPKGDVPIEYLYWLMRTPAYRSYCRSRATGTTNLGLARDDFLAFPAPEPTHAQLRIVQVLSALEDKIELNRRMTEALEGMARALFRSWFVDFDPVPAKAEGRNPAVAEPIADQFPPTFEDPQVGLVPQGWRLGRLGDEFSVTMGQSPPGDTYNEVGEGMPFYQGRRDFGFRFPTRRVYCVAPTRVARTGDTLVSVRAPVGDINMAAEDCAIGRGVAAVRHRLGVRSYTYQSMASLASAFDHYEGEGTVFGAINKEAFHGLPVFVPPDTLIRTFEGLVSPVDDRIANNDRQTKTLTAMRDTLLPRLISGQLRVPDVERIAVEAGA